MTAASARALLRSAAGSQGHIGPAPGSLSVRLISGVRASYGLALLCVPGPMITALTGAPVSGRVIAVARVLGVRQLVQAGICGLAPTRGLTQVGVAVDGLHAASMLGLAGVEPGLRRALLAETAIAAGLASATTASLHRQPGVAGRLR
jgi:hypothetical protein